MNGNGDGVSDELLRCTPPHSLEAERAALGAIFIDNRALDAVAEQVSPEDFYAPAHGVIFRVALELRNERKPVDTLSLVEELARTGQLVNVGGAPAIAALTSAVPTSANAEYYARMIREAALLRGMLRVLAEGQRRIFERRDKPSEVLDGIERAVYEAAHRPGATRVWKIAEVNREVFDALELRKSGKCVGIPYGFRDLDELTRGLHEGDLVIVAARPSIGKSTFALNIFRNVVAPVRAGGTRHGAVLFSLEMGRVQLGENLLAARAEVDTFRLRGGFVSDAELGRLDGAAWEFEQNPRVYLDEAPAMSLLELRAKARRLRAAGEIDLVIVDYVQLLVADRDRRGGQSKRHEEVAEISRGLKALARELAIPVVALAQLNRGVTDRPDHRPRMSDLRESGALEQDADVILLLHRDEYYLSKEELEREENRSKRNRAQVIVAKNRNGPVGELELYYAKEFARFADAAPALEGARS